MYITKRVSVGLPRNGQAPTVPKRLCYGLQRQRSYLARNAGQQNRAHWISTNQKWTHLLVVAIERVVTFQDSTKGNSPNPGKKKTGEKNINAEQKCEEKNTQPKRSSSDAWQRTLAPLQRSAAVTSCRSFLERSAVLGFWTALSERIGEKNMDSGCQNQGSHFGVGAPPVLVHFSGDWDVHWGYRGFDPWPYVHVVWH